MTSLSISCHCRFARSTHNVEELLGENFIAKNFNFLRVWLRKIFAVWHQREILESKN